MADEQDVRKFADEYIKALLKGDSKWHLNNADFQGMHAWNKEQRGDSYTQTAAEFEKEFKGNISFMAKKWDKKFSVKSVVIKDDRATVEIAAEGAKSIGSPLQLSKKSGKWKYIMGAVWFW